MSPRRPSQVRRCAFPRIGALLVVALVCFGATGPTSASASPATPGLSARPLAEVPLLASLSSGTRLTATRPAAGTAASAHHAKDATLRVVVRSLPGKLSAKIIVTGPHHVHKRVTRSSTLRLPAGAYSLSAAPVKSSSGSYYATTPRSRVVLHAGKATNSSWPTRRWSRSQRWSCRRAPRHP